MDCRKPLRMFSLLVLLSLLLSGIVPGLPVRASAPPAVPAGPASLAGPPAPGQAPAPDSTWMIETVEEREYLGEDIGSRSLALDSTGHPHLAYSGNHLYYAWRDDTTWHSQVVSNEGNTTSEVTSLALDVAGRPHLSYTRTWVSPSWVRYAGYDGTSWYTETVDSGAVGGETSLALDAEGHPYIAYSIWDGYSYTLRLASYDGTSWYTETVDRGAVEGETSLALDAEGHPCVAYSFWDGFTNTLRLASYDGTAWRIETVDGNNAGNPSLVLDALGRPHVSYNSSDGLMCASYDGTVWRIEAVAGRVGSPLLALDASGRPHISYNSYDSDYSTALNYAYYDGTAWRFETVDSHGWRSSLALDIWGRPHISYDTAFGDSDLEYAFYDSATWRTETVGSTRYMAHSPSLALDTFGRPRISYYDSTVDGLMYAYDPAGCVPVQDIAVRGPTSVPMGISTPYTLTVAPPTATLPVVAWNNGAAGPVASYTWATTGSHTLAATATTPCAQLSTTLAVTVFCQPVAGVAIGGPLATLVGLPTSYQAAVDPITASRPLTLTWDNGSVGPAASYSWPATGTYTLTVTATNACGQAQAGLAVRVLEEWPYYLYIPRFCKQYVPGVCVPVSAAAISGPAQLVVGEEGFYAATFSPPNASWPLELAWDNGSVGPTTAYSWTAPGLYTLTVTATNPCGQAAASFPVSVTASPCQPVATAAITGPATLVVGELALYTATVSPPTATLPLTLTWDSGAVCPTAAYSWTEPGLYTVTVTATNPCGEVSAVLPVSVTAAACRPVQTVAITGPLTPCTGQPTLYTATVFPPTATLPLTLTWDNGAVGPTAAYFWTAMGAYTLTVTATNACGQVHGDLHVLVCPEVAERRLALGDRLLVAAFRRLLC